MSDPLQGINLGGYQVVGRLGRGAMADVYDAVDSTGHEVALKVFKAGGGMSYTMLERFRREAEATKILRRHPYILTVYASGHQGDYHFIAMEKVTDSRGLDSFIHRNPPRAELLKIGIKLAEALQYAHEHQIIHRDVKPSNVLLDEFNEPMLTDFGVAELTDWPSLTLSGALTGTPMYMAPEQARGETAQPASDVYSLGVVMYEAVTKQMPYELAEAAPTSAILDAVKHQQPLPPRQVDKTVSRDLNYVLLRALRKSPDERYDSAREFALDLQAVLDGKPVAGRWVSPWTRLGFWTRRHRTALAGALTFALLAVIGWLSLADHLRARSYGELIHKAEKVSLRYKNAELTSKRGEPELTAGRKAMLAGRWLTARDMLQTAVRLFEELEQERPLAEARLELARVEVMLHNSLRAMELYETLWSDERLPDSLRQLAAFESLLLLLLDGREERIAELKSRMAATSEGPYFLLMRSALGETLSESVREQMKEWQPRLRRNAVLAAVVRERDRRPRGRLVAELETLLAEGGTTREWPLPFADYIRGRL